MTTRCGEYSNGLVRELTESIELCLSKYESGDIYKLYSTRDPKFNMKCYMHKMDKDRIKCYILSKIVESELNKYT